MVWVGWFFLFVFNISNALSETAATKLKQSNTSLHWYLVQSFVSWSWNVTVGHVHFRNVSTKICTEYRFHYYTRHLYGWKKKNLVWSFSLKTILNKRFVLCAIGKCTVLENCIIMSVMHNSTLLCYAFWNTLIPIYFTFSILNLYPYLKE